MPETSKKSRSDSAVSTEHQKEIEELRTVRLDHVTRDLDKLARELGLSNKKESTD